LVLFLAFAPKNLLADDWDHATKVTFNEPAEVPGRVLEAGTYWFRLADSDSDRNIVQIWNADQTQLITTILAIPDYRLKTPGKTILNFEERPSGSPEAIHAWFYPGDNFGQEFVYPKVRATQLAQQTSRPVLSMPDEQPAEQVKQAPVKAVTPSGEEIEMTEVLLSQPAPPPQTVQPALPQTGSPLPVLALLGIIALAATVGLQVYTGWITEN
jgi:hypothetical protein